MRWIPPGTFLMGSPPSELGRSQDEGPQHEVTLTQGYWLGATPVTQALWLAVMGNNPSWLVHGDYPVAEVTWDECLRFVGGVNERLEGFETRLPTEAEWERACRGGRRGATWVGELSERKRAPQLEAIGWYGGNSDGEAQPVGRKEPNPFGLHDLLGNVWEWCADGKRLYRAAPVTDPAQAGRGELRVVRGGSWDDYAMLVRAASRREFPRDHRDVRVGFRLAAVQGAAPSTPSRLDGEPRSDDQAREAGPDTFRVSERDSTKPSRDSVRGGITLEEIGEIMNLTRERVRQAEVRGLLKWSTTLADAGHQLSDKGIAQTSTASSELLAHVEVGQLTAIRPGDANERTGEAEKAPRDPRRGYAAHEMRQSPDQIPYARNVLAILGVIAAAVAIYATALRPHTSAAPAVLQCPVDMVAIPPRTFRMGSPAGEGYGNEHPEHEVTLSAYCIDRAEVTVKAYTACVRAGSCTAADSACARAGNCAAASERAKTVWNSSCNGARADRYDHPINCVDWEQAGVYCAWAGRRLPTEAEWEYAARGNDGRRYPWGNDPPTVSRLNACGLECGLWMLRELGPDGAVEWEPMYDASDGWQTTAPVGSFPDGASPFGAQDMAGNVWEWTADWYASKYDDAATSPLSSATRVVRGGDWNDNDVSHVTTTYRSSYVPSYGSSFIGFRCARAN
jgi:formylglycine-generating enzyme required for sulfatase activity